MAINGTDYDEYYQKAVYMTDEEMEEEDERIDEQPHPLPLWGD